MIYKRFVTIISVNHARAVVVIVSIKPHGLGSTSKYSKSQRHKGKAKPYQVKQVLLAIEKIEVHHGS